MEDPSSTYKACHLAPISLGCSLWCCCLWY